MKPGGWSGSGRGTKPKVKGVDQRKPGGWKLRLAQSQREQEVGAKGTVIRLACGSPASVCQATDLPTQANQMTLSCSLEAGNLGLRLELVTGNLGLKLLGWLLETWG